MADKSKKCFMILIVGVREEKYAMILKKLKIGGIPKFESSISLMSE